MEESRVAARLRDDGNFKSAVHLPRRISVSLIGYGCTALDMDGIPANSPGLRGEDNDTRK